MSNPLLNYLRAHTATAPSKRWHGHQTQPKYPEYALIFDCETTMDTSQALTFGGYQVCHRVENGEYVCVEEGLFFDDGASNSERLIFQEFGRTHRAEVVKGFKDQIQAISRSKFVEKMFYLYELEALIVGFNLPFDSSRYGWEVHQ